MANTSENHIRAIVFNIVGRATETGPLPFTTLIVSTGNSGYSVGALQTDFGQHRDVGRDLISQYQSWAPADRKLSVSEEADAQKIIAKKGLGASGERLDP